jgi:hypothetical protein
VIKIRVEGSGGTIVADLIARALRDVGIKVSHATLDYDTPKEKAAATRMATSINATVAIYEMPSARIRTE